MLNIKAVKDHLLSRPIAVAFSRLNGEEKNDETALKFMFIIDFVLQRDKLYEQIGSTKLPKLLQELVGFHSYKYFTYFDYQDSPLLRGKYLQCSKCKLFGPYTILLTHMASNHNYNTGNKLCAFCKQIELKDHFEERSLQTCFSKYIRDHGISEVELGSTSVHNVTQNFYSVLLRLCKSLDITVTRNLHRYGGGQYRRDFVTSSFDPTDRDLQCTRNFYKRNVSTIPHETLHGLFVEAVEHICGGDALARFILNDEMEDQNMSGNMEEPEETPNQSEQFESYFSQPSTSHAYPRETNGSTPLFPDRRQSTMSTSYGMSTPAPSDRFLSYLGDVMADITDPQLRRRAEQQMLKIANEASFASSQ